MGKYTKIVVFLALIFLTISSGTIKSENSGFLKAVKKYQHLINKCSKIKKEKKRKKCQKKFLIKFRKIHGGAGTLKEKTIEYMDPKIWKSTLLEIAEAEKDNSLSAFALNQLNDQDELKKMFEDTELNWLQRSTALNFIKNEDYLIDIAKYYSENFYRSKATAMIKDQETLQFLVFNDLDKAVRLEAAKNITDQLVLQKVVMTDKNEDVLIAASLNLDITQSFDFLKAISNHTSTHVKRIAKLKLIISDLKVKKLHGKLKLEYQTNYKSKLYGHLRKKAQINKEFLTITITDLKNNVKFKKNYKGRNFPKTTYYKKEVQILWVTINFAEIEKSLKKKQ